MTRVDKLYDRLLANSRQAIAFRDFEKLLEAFGFTRARTIRGAIANIRTRNSGVRSLFSPAARMPKPIRFASFWNW